MLLLLRILSFSALFALIALSTSCSSPANQKVVRTYALGERAQVGPLIYNVFETKWVTQIGQDPSSARIPTHRFFLVRMSIVNGSSQEVSPSPLTITDDTGQSFTELSNGDGIPQWVGYLRHIKPANSMQGNIVFDAPPRHYKLNLTDELDENKVIVDIPLTFTHEGPEIQLPIPTPGGDPPGR